MSRGQLSPELALVDPRLSEWARSLLADAGSPTPTKEEEVTGDVSHLGNGHTPAPRAGSPAPPGFSPPSAPVAPAVPAAEAEPEAPPPSVETLIFRSGLVTADQLGELAQLHAQTGRPIEEIAVERGIIAPHVLQQILRGETVTPPAPETAVPAPTPAHAAPPAPGVHTPSPAPAEAAAAPVAAAVPQPASAPVALRPSHEPAYAVVVRLQGGDTLQDGLFRANEEAASRASALARRFAEQPDEWVAIGGSLVRPAAVLAVSVEPRLSGVLS